MKSDRHERIRARLEALDARMEAWREKVGRAGADVQENLSDGMDALTRQRSRVQALMERIGDAGEGAWEDIREEVEELIGKMRARLDRALDRDEDELKK